MNKDNAWFKVDKEGLRELQAGKAKWRLIGELVQNAFDEDITACKVDIAKVGKFVEVTVEDDSERGFRNLEDAYTLFGNTYKRSLSEKRGRFNLGEKLLLSIAEEAKVSTTTGTVIFDSSGRKETKETTKKGTIIFVKLIMADKEVKEVVTKLRGFIAPDSVKYIVNEEEVPSRKIFKTFETSLTTEVYSEEKKVMSWTTRKTKVDLYDVPVDRESYIYEMGIPIQKIACQFDVDVQQKIPLGMDRVTVSPAFLQDLFAEVLNVTVKQVEEEDSSALWIRKAMTDERVKAEVVEEIIEKRWGDKVCVRDLQDQKSVDEAITHGYKVLSGGELSKEEWGVIRAKAPIPSSSKLFGSERDVKEIIIPEKDWTPDQRVVSCYAKMIAKKCLGKSIEVVISKADTRYSATYGNGRLTFNLYHLSPDWWKGGVCERTTDLILHELGHEGGTHYEHGYHETLTKVGAKLVALALKEPIAFKIVVAQ